MWFVKSFFVKTEYFSFLATAWIIFQSSSLPLSLFLYEKRYPSVLLTDTAFYFQPINPRNISLPAAVRSVAVITII